MATKLADFKAKRMSPSFLAGRFVRAVNTPRAPGRRHRPVPTSIVFLGRTMFRVFFRLDY